MAPIFSKLKGMLCIPDRLESHSESAGSQKPTQPKPDKTPNVEHQPVSNDSSSSASTTDFKRSEKVLEVLRAFDLKNIKTIKDVALQQIDGEPINDKTYLMERIIQLAADLPIASRTSDTLTNSFLNQLWTDLQHPPQSHLGQEYIYRKADGSNNNILWPHLGAAGQPYARTVRPRKMQPVARPDPGVIFDSLLARKTFKPHPNKISSVLFYVASIIIHDIFHTSHQDYSISETSSYLDLAPLYGNSQTEQESVRTMRDGKLKPDCFSDIRILGFPPGVGVLLIMFNRFHNHVAEHLAMIDEGGRFSSILNPRGKPKPPDAEKLYDEALFQTARLITTGLYINIILKDYVRTILNLNRVDSLWNLDPRSEEGKAIFGHSIPEATGNSVSAEFNLIYRWHACVSERDEQWTKDVYSKLFGQDSSLSLAEFLGSLNGWAKKQSPDPLKRDFADLERLSNGQYRDDQLASIWTASVSDVAGRFGAGHVPEILKNVEILGIIQSRSWNLASLNELREYFKLQPHETFEDINPDPIIAEQLRHLYGHPDNVEIYPGVVVEAAKEAKLPGSGLCTSFTISRAILSDAVALVRGDRFYTVDYTPANLTNWGFNEANYDLSINCGCVFYKLVLTAFPNQYRPNSIYAHYPLVIPEENKAILTRLKKSNLYNFDRPTDLLPVAALTSLEACKTVVGGTKAFRPTWDAQTFSPGSGLQKSQEQVPLLAQKLVADDGLPAAAAAFYRETIDGLLKSNSYQLAGSRQVDVIRDVFNIAHARFVASLFLLPLGPKARSHDAYDESEMISLLSTVYSCANPEEEPPRRFELMKKRQQAIRQFAERVQEEAGDVIKGKLGSHPHSTVQLRIYAMQAVQALCKNGMSHADVVWNQLLPLASRVFVHQSRTFAEGLDYLLGEGKMRLEELQQMLDLGADSSQSKIRAYVREIHRLQPTTPIFREAVSATTVVDDGKQVHISAGQRIFCDMTAANHDTKTFPNPTLFDSGRSQAGDPSGGFGAEVSLEDQISTSTLSSTFAIICRLGKLSRAVGATGQIRRLRQGNVTRYLNVEESTTLPCPVSMIIKWQE